MRRFMIWVFAALAGPVVQGAAAANFYLSTDRIFGSREEVVLKVESLRLKALDLRIYAVPDPEAFFLRQENPYQVQGYGKRAPGIKQIGGMFFSALREDVADVLREKTDPLRLDRVLRRQVKQVLRVADRKPHAAGRGYLAGFPLLRELRVELASVTNTEWKHDLVALPIHANGVYLIEGMVGDEAGYCVAMVSDLAVLSRHSENGLLLFTADRHSGVPQADAQVTLLSGGKAVARARTDKDGIVRIPTGSGTVSALVRSARGAALLDSTYYPSSSFAVNPDKVHLSTDRPVYKPGQTAFFKAVVRSYKDQAYLVPRLNGRTIVAEVSDGSGTVIATPEVRLSTLGTISGSVSLPQNARPGLYSVAVSIDGRKYDSVFRVQHYVKPPFKVDVAPAREAVGFHDKAEGVIRARYFFGDPVAGAAVRYMVYRRERFRSQFAGEPFGWYLQDNEYRNTREELVYEGEGVTDANGEMPYSFAVNAANLRGKAYHYRIEARIRDSSNRLVMGSGGFQVREGQFYLLLTPGRNFFRPGEDGEFRVEAFDYEGKPVKGRVFAKVTYYRWTSATLSRPAEQLVVAESEVNLAVTDSFRTRFERAGHYHVQVTGKDSSGNAISTGRFVWVAGNAEKLFLAETGLTVVADKKLYSPGETASLLVLSPVPDLQLLMTLEGDTLFEHRVVRMKGNSIELRVRVVDKLVPNVTMAVAGIHEDRTYQARQQLFIPPKEKFLNLSVEGMQERYRPGEKVEFAVRVRDSRGRGVAGEVAVAVIDEAIFSVQAPLVPAIEQFFYHAHRNNVIAGSSFTTRFYGYGEQDRLELARRARGDTALADMNKGQARQYESGTREVFKDRAYWNSRLVTDAAGLGKVSFTLPDNITSWRIGLNAVDNGDRVGGASFNFIARKEFFARAAVPERVFEGEELSLGFVAHNRFPEEKSARAALTVRGATLLGAAEREVRVPARGELPLEWRLKAGAPGRIMLDFALRGPEHDLLKIELPAEPFGRRLTETYAGPTPGEGPVRLAFRLPEGPDAALAGLSVRVSPNLVYMIEDSLKYLVDFPYGCVEQTISRFVPNLYVLDIQKRFPFRDEQLRKIVPEMVSLGLSRMAMLQREDGSWAWFGNSQADVFMSAYAVYALAHARQLGYQEQTENLLERGAAWLEGRLAAGEVPSGADRAFVLLALSEHARENHAAQVGRAIDALGPQDTLAAILLAGAAQGGSQAARGERLLDQLVSRMERKLAAGGIRTQTVAFGTEAPWEWRQDANIANGLLLRFLVRSGKYMDVCREMVNHLLARKEEGGWRSTLDTAFILLAFADYSKRVAQREQGRPLVVVVNGSETRIERTGYGQALAFGKERLRPGANQVEISAGPDYFYFAGLDYYARRASFEASTGDAVRLERRYYRLARTPENRYRIAGEITGEAVRGETVLVRITAKPRRPIDYFMLEESLPSGFQFIDERDPNLVEGVNLKNYSAHELYPGRAVFFAHYLPVEGGVISYLAVPTIAGDLKALPAYGNSMYYPEIAGHGASSRLRVVAQ